MTNAVAASTKPQPVLASSQLSAADEAVLSESVPTAPQTTTANMINAVTPKTAQSVRGFPANSGLPCSSVEW
ncbi:hypothetical protein GCM10009545_08030 [Saccharopolyspora thermophila]|uniref:Uncharacterized protein n=1 Tax=Saccharopolyspora thermophila TaxID=89367 RepID=A0ABP3LWJ5_9PSEU